MPTQAGISAEVPRGRVIAVDAEDGHVLLDAAANELAHIFVMAGILGSRDAQGFWTTLIMNKEDYEGLTGEEEA